MDQKDKHQTFLIIDEVYDARERVNLPLTNPYLIQVSTGEQTLMYPMVLNQVVDVSCKESKLVQKRKADNDETLTSEGDKVSHKDSLQDITTQEDGAIKSDFSDFISVNGADVKSRASGNDLLLYIHDPNTTAKTPFVELKRIAKVQHHHDISDTTTRNLLPFGSFSSEKKKIQIKFTQNVSDQKETQNMHEKQTLKNSAFVPLNEIKPISSDNFHHLDEGFNFKGSPKQFGRKSIKSNSATNPYRFPDAAIHYHKNHQHHHLIPPHYRHLPSHEKNRFYVNQNGNKADGENTDEQGVIENVTSAGVINDQNLQEPQYFKGMHQTNKQRNGVSFNNDRNRAMKNRPNLLDDHVTFDKDEEHDEVPKFYHEKNLESEEKNEGENANDNLQFGIQLKKFNQNNGRHYDKLQQSFGKSPAGDNRKLPIDSFRRDKPMMKQLNGGHEYHQMANGYRTKQNDDGKLNENDHYYGANINHYEPIDNEDDPNLLVERENSKSSRKIHANFNHKAARNRFKRFFRSDSDATSMITRFLHQTKRSFHAENHLKIENQEKSRRYAANTQNLIKSTRFSVYALSMPVQRSSIKIQVFRKHHEKWFRVQPEFIITSHSEKFTSGNFHARLSSRRSSSSLFDVNRTMLLVPSNETSLGSLMTLKKQMMPVSTDEIKQSICPSTVYGLSQIKRSVQKLLNSGLMPKHGDAITKCPSNADQTCLNLKAENPPTLKLEIQLPFLHNELIDTRTSSVKISNIFIDTSDGANLFAQFEITSMDHFTKSFNLSLRGCALLEPLNVSHSLRLPPNRSVMVNLSIPLPFYAEHKQEKCEVNIVDETKRVVAQRKFLMDPKGARCLCLWFCACYCFGSFLTVEAIDLCHVMTPKSEIYAGFYDANGIEEMEDEIEKSKWLKKHLITVLPLMVFIVAFLLGFIKGCLGYCSTRVNAWKFNLVHPCVNYQDSSRFRRFIVNICFFFLLPIACCTKYCFSSKTKCDSNASICGQKITQKEIYSDEESEEDDEEGENMRLLRPGAPFSDHSSIFEKYRKSSETVFDVRSLKNPFDDEQLEDDTAFVVNAINESHESLCKLEKHQSEVNVTTDPRFQDAQKLVKELLSARIVYRRFTEPYGNVKVNENQMYSIRGYFIPAQDTGYQFMTYNPIRQIYEISSTLTMVSLVPQIALDSKAFRHFYVNKVAVLEANDLSIHPSSSAPCVNVLVQDHSMYGD